MVGEGKFRPGVPKFPGHRKLETRPRPCGTHPHGTLVETLNSIHTKTKRLRSFNDGKMAFKSVKNF